MATEPSKVFGVPIDQLVKAQHAKGGKSDIPNVVTETILWLDSHQATKAINVFRAVGHGPTVLLIKGEFEAGTWSAANHPREDMHSVAALLKLFLRSLPDSIFPNKYYTLALKIAKEVSDPAYQSFQFRSCVYCLPKYNRDTILYLSNFLHRVAHDHQENGGMDAPTLARIFGPYLLRPPPTNPIDPEGTIIPDDTTHVALVVQRLIEEAPFLFKTTSRPKASPSSPYPTSSLVNGRALYPYPGGGQYLLPLKKDEIATIIDIKNEDGWLKVDMGGANGYIPLAYVQLVAAPPPEDKGPRGFLQAEFSSDGSSDPVVPDKTPPPVCKTEERNGLETPAIKSARNPILDSPHLSTDSPVLSPKFSSPDLSAHHAPPPPILSPPPPTFSAPPSSTPPPPPLSVAPPPPLSAAPPPPFSMPPPPPPLLPPSFSSFSTSPPLHVPLPLSSMTLPPSLQRANSLDTLPAPPPLSLPPSISPPPSSDQPPSISPRGIVPSLSSSLPSLPNKLASSADAASAVPSHIALPTKLSRSFSYSQPPRPLIPPPSLIVPTLPVVPDLEKEKKEKEETERKEREETEKKSAEEKEKERKEGEAGGDKEESDEETDEEDSGDEESSGEEPPKASKPPPPAPPVDLQKLNREIVVDVEKEAANAKKRKERAEEVLATERTYVKQLNAVYEGYMEPLKKKEKEKTPMLAPGDLYNIFSNLEVILTCHKKLLDLLEKRMQNWDSKPELGDIFLENTTFVKLYKHYVNNFDKSIVTLKNCKENVAEFREFAKELDYSEKLSNLSVESFLILPVQRIPRYVLLLTDLLKYTSASHKDFDNLTNALMHIKDLAEYINSNKSDSDNTTKMASIQASMTALPPDLNLVVPRRRFVEDGAIIYKKQKAWLFLFSDALVFTRPVKKGKKFKAFVHLPTSQLLTDEPGMIKILGKEGTFKFTAENPRDRDHWVKLIRETMDLSQTELIKDLFGNAGQEAQGNKALMKVKDEEAAAKKRGLMERMVTSEQEYVDSISYISKTFLIPLRKAADSSMPMVALSDLIDIASNLETLLTCHITFLAALKERVIEWDSKPYAHDLFTEKAAFLKLYNYYVSNHHKSLEMIDVCIGKHPLFAIFLRDTEAREKVELKILLADPLRRVSKYYLDAQEMLQYIKVKTEEYDSMAKVVARLKEQTDKQNADFHDQMMKADKKRGSSWKFKKSSS